MKTRNWLIALAAVGLSWGQSQRAGQTAPETGEAIYRLRCGGCHGLDGKAQTDIGKRAAMRDLTSPEVQRQSDADLIRTIANGRGRMPSYQLILGDDRIKAVVAYIRQMAH